MLNFFLQCIKIWSVENMIKTADGDGASDDISISFVAGHYVIFPTSSSNIVAIIELDL